MGIMDRVYLIMGSIMILFGLVSIPVAITKSAWHGCSDDALGPGFSLLEVQGKHMGELTVWEKETFCNKNTIYSIVAIIVIIIGSVFVMGAFVASPPGKCRKCGSAIESGSRFCDRCGMRLK
ncbi:zinc ribbon domain-containing protein [Candidatus Woesearchaeota archaeon]|nr:zinc ribbon domain-containing protein [Candidatus Woesearchaeota archaeon]